MTESDARKREYAIKKLSRKQKEELINTEAWKMSYCDWTERV
jgi:predicted GIY-YIG superfamily endonuclease